MKIEITEQLNEFAKMRTFRYFFIASFITFVGLIAAEYGADMHELDDAIFCGLAIVALIILTKRWTKNTVKELKYTNNIMAVLALLMVLISIYAIMIEAGDPTDFGDDIPQLILSIVILLSRFIL